VLKAYGGEFRRSYGEEFKKFRSWLIESGYKALEDTRKKGEEEGYSIEWKLEYKSVIDRKRTEEEDNELLNKVKGQFKEYVSFTGDYLFKNMHGAYVFGKVVEIDVNKIREKEKDPQKKIEDIKAYVESLLPQA